MLKISGNNIFILKGETGFLVFPFMLKGKPFDLTGFTVRFIIKAKKEAQDSTAVFDNNYTPQEVGGNTILIPLTAALTNREPQSFYYGLRLIKGTEVQTILEGNFTVQQGVYNG